MPAYIVASTDITYQRVEDEVIVINLLTGAYYSLRGSSADAWDLLCSGLPAGEVVATLATRFGVATEAVGRDLEAFLAQLLADNLLAEYTGPVEAVELPVLVGEYTAPLVEKYDDMEELLLLDPIHEVDEAGWPIVATEPTE